MSFFPATGKTFVPMSGDPSVLRDAMTLATSWEKYVDEAHDSLTGSAKKAAQVAASLHTGWRPIAQHIQSWVNKSDELVVGLPEGHSQSDAANELEYGSEDAAPQPVLRKAALHDLDGLGRSSSRSLQWP